LTASAPTSSTPFDLSPASAKQLSRQGQALLVLEAGERISLTGTGENLPGTTGLRALARVLNQHGEKIMLSVHDRAAALSPVQVGSGACFHANPIAQRDGNGRSLWWPSTRQRRFRLVGPPSP